jgi:hypothetical protein
MSKLMTDEVAREVRERLKKLPEPVSLLFFTQPHACRACADQQGLLEALAGMSKILLREVHELDSKVAADHGIDKVPATVGRGAVDHGIRFDGLTGGQINDTAVVENYSGLVQVGGAELAQPMREHVEAYPVAERCHTLVEHIERDGDFFRVVTDGAQYCRGRSLISCTGTCRRRLDMPGEGRFIGRGVACCATGAAPPYRDKRLAVVAGGNSAFTAVRDRLRYSVN